MSENNYIECGKIINTHGCHGGLKLESWCNTPQDLSALKDIYLYEGEKYVKYKVKKSSIFKQYVIMDLYNVEDMDAALSLKNKTVYAARKDFKLKDGEFFIADIIGKKVIDVDTGKVYGTISDIINRGASDIYVVQTEYGERMIPAVDEFIIRVDIQNGVYVRIIPGLLD